MGGTIHRVVTFALIGALFAGLACDGLAAEPPAANLVSNPGFEDGAAKWHLPAGFKVVQGAAAHAGGSFLDFVRTDKSIYELASQRIDFRPGARYKFSAWVWTKGVVGEESGATVCMEWSGPKGWIGGAYPDGRKGDNDWFRVVGITPPIPREAAGVSVTLYLRQGMTGEARFDDVEVAEYEGRPLEAYLIDPAYRGLVLGDEPRRPIRVHVDLADRLADGPWLSRHGISPPAQPQLYLTLVQQAATGEGSRGAAPGYRQSVTMAARPGKIEHEFDAAGLEAGDFSVEVGIKGATPPGQSDLGFVRLGGRVIPPGRRPRVYIDRHRRTVVEGKPFFPLGFYLDTIHDADLEKIAAAGFNCVMPYAFSSMPTAEAGKLLDLAQGRGIKVIYSIKDLYAGTECLPKGGIDGKTDPDAAVTAVVERFRSHPGVLAWYLNDELPATMRDALEARYRLVRRLDPDHPTWAVLYQVDELADYRHTCDVLGADPYPVPDKPVAMAADWARKTRDATGGACAFWQVPQVFDWANYHKNEDPARHRAATYDEMRVMTYLALVNGAKGLIYYSFYDLKRDRLGFDVRWKDVSRLGAEVRSLMPALLATGTAPRDVAVSGPGGAAVFREGNRLWVLVANPDKAAATVRLAVPKGVGSLKTLGGRSIAVGDGPVVEELKPLACETYVMELP
jgi:hypothetical protein